jgi:hypothetical protein
MGLIIDQGKQVIQEVKETTEKKFELIEAEQIQGVITEVTQHKFLEDNLSIKVQIIDEPYKNRVVYGDANYNPTSKLNFTYQNLRTSAGFPYEPGENPKLDVEKLLMNKVVTIKLFIRDGKDGKQYQGLRWIPIRPNVLAPKKEETDFDKEAYDAVFKGMVEMTDPLEVKPPKKAEVSDWEDPVVGDDELPF